MNKDQIMSILRNVFVFAGGWVVAQGWFDAETWIQLSGAIVTIIGVAAGFVFHKGANKSALVAVASGVATTPEKIQVIKAVGAAEVIPELLKGVFNRAR